MGTRGPQPGTGGRPKKPLRDKIRDGDTGKTKPRVVKLPDTPDLTGETMPEPHAFLSAAQRNGQPLVAADIYHNTWNWLNRYRCAHLFTQTVLEQYSMSAARWIQVEQCITEHGFLAKHPTTGQAIASPFVGMSVSYGKQTMGMWNHILAVVRENCSMDFAKEPSPQDDVMERLLSARQNKRP